MSKNTAATISIVAATPCHQVAERPCLASLLSPPVAVVPESAFYRPQCIGVVVGQLVGDRSRIVADPGDEPHPQGVLCVDHTTAQREVEGVGRRKLLGEADRPAPGPEQSKPDAALGERRRRGGDPQVARECEFYPTATGGAVDSRDDHGVGAFDPSRRELPAAGKPDGFLAVQVVDDVEVGAGTERGPLAAEVYDGARGVVYRPPEVRQRRGCERVPAFRPRERDHVQVTVRFDVDHTGDGRGVSKGLWPSVTYSTPMDEAAKCRRAAREAVRDIDPPELRNAIETALENDSMMPGALTLVTARAATADDLDVDTIAERAAGVQLIYEGLSSIRNLAATEPWADVPEDDEAAEPGEIDDALTESNVAVLAADVAVSRGFYLLARTDAAGKAVETVRAFGRDQTLAGDDGLTDGSLEVDVLELAVIAGATSVGADPTQELLSRAAELARDAGAPFPPAEGHLPEPAEFDGDVDVRAGATDGGTPTTATDP